MVDSKKDEKREQADTRPFTLESKADAGDTPKPGAGQPEYSEAELARQAEQRRQTQEHLDNQEAARQQMAAQTKAQEEREAKAKKKQ